MTDYVPPSREVVRQTVQDRTPSFERAEARLRLDVKLAGCDCAPRIEVDPRPFHSYVAHQPGCALYRA